MLGVDAGFIGSIGLDETGDFYERDMKDAGVNTMLFRKESVTGTAVVLITPDSERTFAVHLGAAAELDAKDLKPALFSGHDILYVEGYLINNLSLIETACVMAKEQNMIIALDLSSYNVVEANLTGFKKIVEGYVDIIFANEEEAKAYTGLIPREALNLLSETNEVVVIKVGADGSWLKRGEEIVKISSLTVSCNDTTGAGDLYASGFLYGIANGLDLEKCGTIGSLMAGKVIEIIGARMEEARFKEIKKTIKEIIE
jgi:sugar/nucleoside kinase (ribokinase family)